MSKIKHGAISKAEETNLKTESMKALEKMKELEVKFQKKLKHGMVNGYEISSTKPMSKSRMFNYVKNGQ